MARRKGWYDMDPHGPSLHGMTWHGVACWGAVRRERCEIHRPSSTRLDNHIVKICAGWLLSFNAKVRGGEERRSLPRGKRVTLPTLPPATTPPPRLPNSLHPSGFPLALDTRHAHPHPQLSHHVIEIYRHDYLSTCPSHAPLSPV